jgi:hypothetical protein
VVLHNPVIGRATNPGGEVFLPATESLNEVKHSWEKVFCLTPEQLVSSKVLLSDLRGALVSYLRQNWVKIISALDQLLDGGKFTEVLKLDRLPPVVPPNTVRIRLPPPASYVITSGTVLKVSRKPHKTEP